MKKIKIPQKKLTIKLKIILIILSVCFLFGGLYLSYVEKNKHEVDIDEITTYSYQFEPKIGYRVKILPNPIYPTTELGEDKIYTRELVDKIHIYLKENFEASEVTQLEGQYRVGVEVRGYRTVKEGEVEKEETVWSKDMEIIPMTSIVIDGEQDVVEAEVIIEQTDLAAYEAYVEEAMEVTKIKPTVTVRVYMEGKLEGSTVHGSIEKVILNEVKIPIGGETFEIEKLPGASVSNTFTEKIETPIPVNSGKVRLGYMLAILGGVLGIGILIFTRKPTVLEVKKMKIDKALRNYGTRMAEVEAIDTSSFVYYFYIKGIEDLVKVADEIQRPIVYQRVGEKQVVDSFYIMDKQNVYIYTEDLEESITQEVAKQEETVVIDTEEAQNQRKGTMTQRDKISEIEWAYVAPQKSVD